MNTKKSGLIRPGSHGYCTVSGDTRDCTVRAAVNATGLDYTTVYNSLKKHGRIDGRGAVNRTILPAYMELGLHLIGTCGSTQDALNMRVLAKSLDLNSSCFSGVTLGTFLGRKPQIGTSYVCLNRNHAFAIVDGHLVDNMSLPAGTRITSIFSVVK